jgi:hypothetical protein
MRKRFFIPTTDGLLALLNQRALRTREALQAAGAKGYEARRLNELKRKRAHWRSKRDGGLTYAGVDHKLKLALAGWKVLTARMVPGEWYAVTDMAELLPEYAYRSAKAWSVKLRKLGITERTRNPDLDGSRAPGNQMEPVWLHRLTARGAECSKAWKASLVDPV